MAFNAHVSGAHTRNKPTVLAILSNGVTNFAETAFRVGSKFRANARLAVRAVQTARMVSTLMNMTDNQLAQVGISRSEIPQYAEKLMMDE